MEITQFITKRSVVWSLHVTPDTQFAYYACGLQSPIHFGPGLQSAVPSLRFTSSDLLLTLRIINSLHQRLT